MALLLVLLVLAVAVLLGTAYLAAASVGRASTNSFAAMARARCLAESGAWHAVALFRDNPGELLASGGTMLGPFTLDDSGDRYEFSVQRIGESDDYTVFSRGTSGAARQVCRVLVRYSEGSTSALSQAMLLGGNDVYWLPESLRVEGPVHANGHCVSGATLRGSATATGWFLSWGSAQPMPRSHTSSLTLPEIAPEDYHDYVYDGRPGQAAFRTDATLGRNDDVPADAANPAGVLVVRPPAGQSAVWVDQNFHHEGTLIVQGDLYLAGNNIDLECRPGFPALIVTGRLYVYENAHASIRGVVWAGRWLGAAGKKNSGSHLSIQGALLCPGLGGGADQFAELTGSHSFTFDAGLARLADPQGGADGVAILRWDEQ